MELPLVNAESLSFYAGTISTSRNAYRKKRIGILREARVE
jgi:hypothetical protein